FRYNQLGSRLKAIAVSNRRLTHTSFLDRQRLIASHHFARPRQRDTAVRRPIARKLKNRFDMIEADAPETAEAVFEPKSYDRPLKRSGLGEQRLAKQSAQPHSRRQSLAREAIQEVVFIADDLGHAGKSGGNGRIDIFFQARNQFETHPVAEQRRIEIAAVDA